MRRIKEVLRLKCESGLGQRQIARSFSIGQATVNDYLRRAEAGRLATVTYGPGSLWNGYAFSTGTCGLSSFPYDKYVETYSYLAAGGVTSKRIQFRRDVTTTWPYYTTSNGSLEVDYTYNSAGQVATTTYPMAQPFCPNSPPYCGLSSPVVTLTYGFDSMGRPNSLTDSTGNSGYPWNYTGSTSNGPINWAQNVSYDYAGRMSSLQYFRGPYCCVTIAGYAQQTMSYNTNGQLSSLAWAWNNYGSGFTTPTGFTYTYSSTQNNGQITQMTDALSGETVSYAYDQLQRLSSASSTASWSQTYTYDGFGNLTAKGGSAPQTLSVSASTNRLTSAYYDANGNMTSGFGATLTYDEANRVASAAETSGGIEYYIYGADNKRIYRMASSGTEYWTFYGAFGEKLGVYTFSSSGFVPYTSNIYFAGKLIVESGYPAYIDRAGTNKGIPNGYGFISSYTHYYPYGEEISGATTNDHEKFATYIRDSYTGIDYADQRYYTSTFGRFNSPDPYMASGGPASPASWNRYSYTRGDPVNRTDRHGLFDTCGDPGDYNYMDCWPGTDPETYYYYLYEDNSDYYYVSATSYPCPSNSVDLETAVLDNPIAYGPCLTQDPFFVGIDTSTPTCQQVLTVDMEAFLMAQDPKLYAWDPTLASDMVSVGAADNVDPRLMLSIATLESGHGYTFGGKNNPFGLRPGLSFPSPFAAVQSQGITLKHLIGYGDTSVSLLYSGKAGRVDPRGHTYVQIPGYCQGVACPAAGQTIAGFLSSFGGNPSVGLSAANPSKLGYPCP